MRRLLPFSRRCTLVVALGAFISIGPARAQYTLTTIVESGGPLRPFTDAPSINNAGTVAFKAFGSQTGARTSGVYTGNGGAITTIADTNELFTDFYGTLMVNNLSYGNASVSINDNGMVAFHASLNVRHVSGIFMGNGSTITAIATTNGPFSGFGVEDGRSSDQYSLSINNNGSVAFIARLDAGGEGVFASSGGPTTTIADTSPASPFRGFSGPNINDNGTVAFYAVQRPPQGYQQGIFTGTGGATTAIFTRPSSPGINISDPAINNSGTVAFTAYAGGSGSVYGIYTSNGGYVKPDCRRRAVPWLRLLPVFQRQRHSRLYRVAKPKRSGYLHRPRSWCEQSDSDRRSAVRPTGNGLEDFQR